MLSGKDDEPLRIFYNKLNLEALLSIREANANDVLICYKWANDPDARKFSYNQTTIPFAEHQKWFDNKLIEPNSNYYIIEHNSEPIGQIRFDGDEEKIISYLVSAYMRGKGLGSIILEKGIEFLLQNASGISKISGYVKKSNIASCKVFERAGFSISSTVQNSYPDSLKYELFIQ